MSVSIKKLPGVESVHVFLKRGLVDIKLKPGNTIRIEQIRKAIENNAFTPKSANVVVVGKVVSQSGKLHFNVAGTNEMFPLATTAHKSMAQGSKPRTDRQRSASCSRKARRTWKAPNHERSRAIGKIKIVCGQRRASLSAGRSFS